ncbi:MAG: type III-A CRISPR-associated protein Cas10/Csm1 [Candidatus Hydrogenedentes bacterium]|nr:type III-A CRISPR-associated protein Cas10/Csm1 [Candidatus Hydrogenedentota bacterium]
MNVYEIAIGALLHDIGKFMQRAHRPDDGLGPQSRGMENVLCPVFQGRYSHRHVLYTNEFVERLPFLPQGISKSHVANLASFHHRPETPEQVIIRDADHLSSGMDRQSDSEDAPGGPARFRSVRLRSVATAIGPDGLSLMANTGFPLARLDAEAAFPRTGLLEEDLTEEYLRLWKQFITAWDANECKEPAGYIARALGVLESYTWCIPSATNALPDISLYDHLKTTAAIAVALAGAPPDNEKPFLLAAADLTGIQKYIFGFKMGAGGLARRLRARSLNAGIYCQSAVLKILHHLEMPLTQVILMAGGKFHLLLPNTPEARACLERTAAEASEWLMDVSAGETALALAHIPCARGDIEDFSPTLGRLHQALRDERFRASHTRLIRDGRWAEDAFIFDPLVGRDEQLCDCCGKNAGRAQYNQDGEEITICGQCDDDGRAGALLPKSRYIAFFTDASGEYATPAGSYTLYNDAGLARAQPAGAWIILDLDGCVDQQFPRLPLLGQVWARWAPKHDDGTLLEFTEIADHAQGVASLAYLKLDVDDLGWMFAQGFKGPVRDYASISRIATLSRTLEVFFRAHIERLLQDRFPMVYLVYSGGDDVLALGPWNQVIDLAERIREDFRDFAPGNGEWKLSAGIALARPHIPVLTAADFADQLLDVSKTVSAEGPVPWLQDAPFEARQGGCAKDRITVFETSIPWSRFSAVMRKAEAVRDWMLDGTLNTGKVRRLMACANLYREFQRTRDTRHFAYAPMLAYDLRRNWKEETDAERAAKAWAAALATPDSEDMQVLRFICEYALYSVRGDAGKNAEEQ